MTNTTETKLPTAVAARVAAEDIQPHDFVAVLNQVYELPPFLWCGSGTVAAIEEPIRLCFMTSDPGVPFKVMNVCLPFVYAKDDCGKQAVFDIRRHQLVRLESKVARKVWKRMRHATKQKQVQKS